jgi:hypothetical protein
VNGNLQSDLHRRLLTPHTRLLSRSFRVSHFRSFRFLLRLRLLMFLCPRVCRGCVVPVAPTRLMSSCGGGGARRNHMTRGAKCLDCIGKGDADTKSPHSRTGNIRSRSSKTRRRRRPTWSTMQKASKTRDRDGGEAKEKRGLGRSSCIDAAERAREQEAKEIAHRRHPPSALSLLVS